MMPWESWPARLALTHPEATACASPSEAPAALSSAAPMRVRRSAWTIGMGFLEMPAREDGSCLLVEAASSQTAEARARPECPCRHAVDGPPAPVSIARETGQEPLFAGNRQP